MRTCNAAGCGKTAAGYSTLCVNHSKTKARHGHPLQTALRRHELTPYENATRKWLETRSSPEAWHILESHWNALVASCRVYSERVGHGRPFHRHTLQACQIILKVNAENRHRDAIVRLLALGYFFHARPQRFLSDEAFRFQVARQFRSLTDASVGLHWDHKAGKVKRVYRDVSPRTLKVLWGKLLECKLVLYGQDIGKADIEEKTRRTYKPQEVRRALLGTAALASGNESDCFSGTGQ